MFEKMAFQNEDEKNDFEKYRELKGDDLFFQIYSILSHNKASVRYVTVRAHIRYDKSLRDKLYIYLATLEEYCRAQLLNSYDVVHPHKYVSHCYKKLAEALVNKNVYEPSTLYYGFQPDFGDLMRICNEKGVCKIDNSSQKRIKDLRNETMHHALILFGPAKTEQELFEHFDILEKRINSFVQALPPDYRAGFLSDILKLNLNTIHNTKHLSRYCLEVQDGKIFVKR